MAINQSSRLGLFLEQINSILESKGLELYPQDGVTVFPVRGASGGLTTEVVCYLKSIDLRKIVQECRFTLSDAADPDKFRSKLHGYVQRAVNTIQIEKQNSIRQASRIAAETFMDEASRLAGIYPLYQELPRGSSKSYSATEIVMREREERERLRIENDQRLVDSYRRIGRALQDQRNRPGMIRSSTIPDGYEVYRPTYLSLDPVTDTQSPEEKLPKRRIKLPPE